MTGTIHNHRYNPCQGCPDRYPGCSDHCEKPDFLTWKAEQAKIRENRKNHAALWEYTAEEILKNRRVK